MAHLNVEMRPNDMEVHPIIHFHHATSQPQADTALLLAAHKQTPPPSQPQANPPPRYIGPPSYVRAQHQMCADIGTTWTAMCCWFGASGHLQVQDHGQS